MAEEKDFQPLKAMLTKTEKNGVNSFSLPYHIENETKDTIVLKK